MGRYSWEIEEPYKMEGPDYVLGLALAPMSEPTGLAVLKRSPVMRDDGQPVRDRLEEVVFRYDVVHLARHPAGTTYTALVDAVADLLRTPELRPTREGEDAQPRLALDATMCGDAVADLFLNAGLPADVSPVTVVGGTEWTSAESGPWGGTLVYSYKVPKLDLVSTVQAGLQAGRLKVVPGLALADLLRKELSEFRIRGPAVAEGLLSWREQANDDLVFAVALAAWLGGHPRVHYISFW